MAGCLFAALTYFPLFKALTHHASPALEATTAWAPITVVADPGKCSSLQFNLVGTSKCTSLCDIAQSALAKAGLNYQSVTAPAGTVAQIRIGDTVTHSYDDQAADTKGKGKAFDRMFADTLKMPGYSLKADPT